MFLQSTKLQISLFWKIFVGISYEKLILFSFFRTRRARQFDDIICCLPLWKNIFWVLHFMTFLFKMQKSESSKLNLLNNTREKNYRSEWSRKLFSCENVRNVRQILCNTNALFHTQNFLQSGCPCFISSFFYREKLIAVNF